MARKIGERNRARPKRIAVVTAVRPVRPPSETPEALSTKVVVVEVPRTAPAQVATASAISAPLMRGSFPFLSSMFALEDTPIRVPMVSNISTNRNANMITKNSPVFRMEKSSFPKIGARLGMESPLEKSGNRL